MGSLIFRIFSVHEVLDVVFVSIVTHAWIGLTQSPGDCVLGLPQLRCLNFPMMPLLNLFIFSNVYKQQCLYKGCGTMVSQIFNRDTFASIKGAVLNYIYF